MLKKTVVIFWCLFFVGTVWSQYLLVTGTAVKSRHYNSGGSVETQYEVAVTLRNSGPQPLVFDALVARFFSVPDACLVEKIVISPQAIFSIRSGENQTFYFSTNGNSSRLWSEDGGQKIKFGFFLKQLGRQTSGFYYTDLPDTNKMKIGVANPLAFKY